MNHPVIEHARHLLRIYRYECLLIVISIFCLFGAVYVASIGNTATADDFLDISAENTQLSTHSSIWVDVSGSVKKPGVYELSDSARVRDAVAKAGGLTDEVDYQNFAKNINLARRLKDEEKIYIPSLGESADITAYAALEERANSLLIHVNTATQTELESLPGIGSVTATKIIDMRPFSTLDELVSRKAIGQATYEKIKTQIQL